MTWHLTRLPRTAHFYWGQSDLPFLRWLSLWTFAHLNPDWRVVLHEPSSYSDRLNVTWRSGEHRGSVAPTRCYRPYLSRIPNLEIRKHDPAQWPEGISEVFRSDLLRWRLLATEGGLWSDMDILYLRPMSELYLNAIPEAGRVESIVCYSDLFPDFSTYSIGFMLAAPDGAHPYLFAHQRAQEFLDRDNYQSLGCHVMMTVFPPHTLRSCEPEVQNLSTDVVYPYSWVSIRRALDTAFTPLPLGERTIGVHWYAGNPLATLLAANATHEHLDGGCEVLRLARLAMGRWPL